MEKPSLPKGTRDFGPAQMAKRQFIMENIRRVFQKYGFMPLETPAMENLDTLTGKYGEEGDQLLFKVLDSGPYYEKFVNHMLSADRYPRIDKVLNGFLRELCEKLNHLLHESSDSWPSPSEQLAAYNKLTAFVNENFKQVLDQLAGTLYLTDPEAEVVEKFIRARHNYLSKAVIIFFHEANLTDNARFIKDFDFHFEQFTNTVYHDGILPDFRKFLTSELVLEYSSRETTKEISEKGLRYDLTVPFARYVVMNRNDFSLPFKRYQMQPVWRADRPQKGRYREFYQCDADVVGTDSLICETEIVLMISEIFKLLAIADYSIKINHREILSGLAEISGASEESALFVAIDKLEKIGEAKVSEELMTKGFSQKSIDTVFEVLNFKGTPDEKFKFLEGKFAKSASGQKGVNDLREVFQLLSQYGAKQANIDFDLSLARGLSYYTGSIFEVKINGVAIGSVSGGGRYDNLTQAFGSKEKLSGVGISFGIDRIYDAMEELNAFPTDTTRSTTVLICHFDKESMLHGLGILKSLRDKGIASEIYPDQKKIDKQLDYANNKKIPFAIIIGSEELKSAQYSLKDLRKGEQRKLGVDGIVDHLSQEIN